MAIVRIARIRLICLLTPAMLALTSCDSAPSNVSVHAGAVLPISSTWPNAAPVSVYYRDQVVTYFVGVPIPPNRPAYLGAPPYPPPSYSVAPGFALPPGLTLETDTGVVSGTPTTTGVYSVAIGATNTAGTGQTAVMSFTIAAAPTPGSCESPLVVPSGQLYVTAAQRNQFGIRYVAGAAQLGSFSTSVVLFGTTMYKWTPWKQPTCPSGTPATTLSRTACVSLYNASASLSVNLAQCPALETQMIWEDGAGNLFKYPSWPAGMVARLDQIYALLGTTPAIGSLGLDCPDPAQNIIPANGTQSQGSLMFTANQAADTYMAQVAHTLYLEIHHLVPWSIFDHPPSELQSLFDSRWFHTRFGSGPVPTNLPPNIHPGQDFWNDMARITSEAVCDPRVGYQFVTGVLGLSRTGANLVGRSELATLKNITGWFFDNVRHGNPANANMTYVAQHQLYYLSSRLAFNSDSTAVPALTGCHSAAGLFQDLGRSVNIPLLAVFRHDITQGVTEAHRGVVYAWGQPDYTIILQHTDDIYAELEAQFFPIAGPGLPAPDQRRALFAATWFSPSYLATLGFVPSNNYGRHTPDQPTWGEDDGIWVGYWPDDPSSNEAVIGNGFSSKYLDLLAGKLCDVDGPGPSGGMQVCGADPLALQSKWQLYYNQATLPAGDVAVPPQAFIDNLTSCAETYTGSTSPATACSAVVNLNKHVPTNWWVGPVGIR
jgi:hypothetical protein